MSKERLEDIKDRYMELEYDFNLRKEDIEWLIKQAERVQELEQKNDKLKQEVDFWRVEDREMMRLSHENKRYREALEFYADSDNYKLERFDPNLDDYMSTVDYDEGKTARNALEGEE